jgi:pyruvate dehydrogenase E1 component alpha subunit
MVSDRDRWLDYYRTMLTIRLFEERVHEVFLKGMVRGTCHLCMGQEAAAVGACAALRPEDQVTSNHRGHGHFIAKGGDPRRIMAELFGKATGYAGGRGGSQHMACFEIGFLGSNGITGGGIPIATGAALTAKLRKTSRVVLCFFGDGAASQGTFHESLNMASLWKLPVVYLCENNLYAMSTPVRDTLSVPNVADRASAYGVPGRIVDGQEVLAVRDAVAEAVARARAGEGPTLVEAKTYRYCGHSRSDECAYRSAEEEAAWRARDPIALFRRRLMDEGLLQEETDEAVRSEVKERIEEAVRFALDSPEPEQ